jgi:annexin A1
VIERIDLKASDLVFPGVDEATIIDILTKRTNAQRQQIKAAYLQENGKVVRMMTTDAQFAHIHLSMRF